MAADEDEREQELVFNLTPAGIIDGVSVAIEENKYKEIQR